MPLTPEEASSYYHESVATVPELVSAGEQKIMLLPGGRAVSYNPLGFPTREQLTQSLGPDSEKRPVFFSLHSNGGGLSLLEFVNSVQFGIQIARESTGNTAESDLPRLQTLAGIEVPLDIAVISFLSSPIDSNNGRMNVGGKTQFQRHVKEVLGYGGNLLDLHVHAVPIADDSDAATGFLATNYYHLISRSEFERAGVDPERLRRTALTPATGVNTRVLESVAKADKRMMLEILYTCTAYRGNSTTALAYYLDTYLEGNFLGTVNGISIAANLIARMAIEEQRNLEATPINPLMPAQ